MNRKIYPFRVVKPTKYARFALHLNSDQAFTLTELMVVLAVLAVLGGLLLPVLASTQERDSRAVCQYNLRQIAVAATQYAGDNDDYVLPASENINPIAFGPNPVAFGPGLSQTAVNEVGLTTNGASIWTCPNRPTYPFRDGLEWVIGYQYYGGITNWINNISSSGHTSDSPVKLSQSKPYWMLAADLVTQPNGLGTGWGSFGDLTDLPAHHTADSTIPQGGNEVFCDGSVQWIDLEKMYFLHTGGSFNRPLYFYQDLSGDTYWQPRIAAAGIRAQPAPGAASNDGGYEPANSENFFWFAGKIQRVQAKNRVCGWLSMGNPSSIDANYLSWFTPEWGYLLFRGGYYKWLIPSRLSYESENLSIPRS